MDFEAVNRVALPALAVLFWVLAGVLPSLRMRRRTGFSGYVAHRAPSPVHRVAIAGMWISAVALVTWVALFSLLGGERLGVWKVPVPMTWAGWLFALSGLAIILEAQVQMGASWRVGIDVERRTTLITSGLFRRVRHPVFAGMLLMSLGVVTVSPGAWSVMAWLSFVWVLSLQTRLEEEHLVRVHGEAYRVYAAGVGRLFPGIGRLSSSVRTPC